MIEWEGITQKRLIIIEQLEEKVRRNDRGVKKVTIEEVETIEGTKEDSQFKK